jgi:hypothetical protein
MPTDSAIRAAVVCRYPVSHSGLDLKNVTYVYFLAEDIDMATATDGTAIITNCQTIEIIAVA